MSSYSSSGVLEYGSGLVLDAVRSVVSSPERFDGLSEDIFEIEDNFVNSLRRLDNATSAPTVSNCTVDADAPKSSTDIAYTVAINILVFFTVSGISAVVDFHEFKMNFRKPPIYIGAAFQFLLMPFLGFLAVLIFPDLGPLEAVALLILTSSPGGSFSNWWCNLLNADLALSVSMTSLSTVASIGMLPLNVLIYVTVAYDRVNQLDESQKEVTIDFKDLGLTLGIVISAIIIGLLFGRFYPQHQQKANLVGNVTGLATIILGVVASADTCDGVPPWRQPFYPYWIATAFPLLVALIGVTVMASLLGLKKPQRVAIALETAYQNTSISLAYTLSQGDAGREAAGIPVIYGGYEAGFFLLFMLGAWKIGWSYAPWNERIDRVLIENWQPGSKNHRRLHPEEYPPVKDADEKKDDEEKADKEKISDEPATDVNDEDAEVIAVEEEEKKKHNTMGTTEVTL